MAGMALAAGAAAAPSFGTLAGQAFASALPQMAMTAAGGIFGGFPVTIQRTITPLLPFISEATFFR